MPAPTVTFLGGVREIGGNKLVIEDGPDRILFDFGPSFSPEYERFYLNYLRPRSTSEVKDLLEFDLLPRVEGLYSETALAGSDLRPTEPAFHGVFVSHAHFDHAGYLHLLDPRIPVYLGAGTRRLLEAIETSSATKYGEHDYRIVPDAQPVKIGRIEVTPFPVDHSIPDAYGFRIRTSEGTLAYTGDFRRHGPRAARTESFLEVLADDPPDSLVIEGTRVGPDQRRNFSEDGVRKGVDIVLSERSELALAASYPRDLDRLRTLYDAAVAVDRDFVVSMRTAHLLATVGPALDPPVPVPGRTDRLRVYIRPKKRYYAWEEPYRADGVDAAWMRQHGSRSLMSIELAHFAELIDIQPPKGTAFIHSMSEPFSEDDVDDEVMHNWIEHFGLEFHQLHASGHASANELEEIIGRVKPHSVFPVHTEHPELFERFDAPCRLPERGVPYPIDPKARGAGAR